MPNRLRSRGTDFELVPETPTSVAGSGSTIGTSINRPQLAPHGTCVANCGNMNSMTTFTLDEDDLPAPGETVEVDLGGGLLALVENTNEPVQEEEVDPPTTYTAVETVGGATVTHAAAVHQRSASDRSYVRAVPATS